ncbi:MAG TPA: stage III sporulation protein AG [Mobilitalea sp.]|nr:stage III sporulation protein AG [Mobilitalea sp.]
MEKKKISLKEIGLPKLVMLFMAGILVILLSVPGIFGSKPSKENNTSKNNANQQNVTNTTSYDSNTYITVMEDRFLNILKQVSGIGDVDVMITLKESEEQVPLKDNPYTQEGSNEVDGEGGSRTNNSVQREENTVLVTEGGNSVPYILKKLEPEVEGVVVIAEGGDNPDVAINIVEAAEVLFNVPAHKVKVMKMSKGIN